MHFDRGYREEAVLRDGTAVTLRLVRPEDKPLLAAGLARLSPESRYRRFLGAKDDLTAAELRYLTEVDQRDHFALGASRSAGDGRDEGLGVARFVRLADRPDVAEAAVVVVDDMHGRGLGRLLLLRLCAAARERGIERFRSQVLAENDAIRGLLDDAAPEIVGRGPGTLLLEVHVPDVAPDAPLPEVRPPEERFIDRLFRAVASQELVASALRLFQR